MKKSIVMLTASAAILLTACNQQPSTEAVLKNEEQRHEIMEAIAEDHKLMMEMHQTMMESDHGRMMMQGYENMMKMMMENHGMMKDMMMKNPEMRQQMMQNMMQMMQQDSAMQNRMTNMMTGHKGMMKGMMKKMHEKGMMSEDCMQSCMKNMEGMDMQHSNGMDGMMDDQGKDKKPMNEEHSDHH